MKILLVCTIFTSLFGCSSIETRHLEYSWQVMHLIDVAQTASGPAGDSDCFHESDPITSRLIGTSPKESDVYKWGIGVAVAHFLLGEWLDSTDLKKSTKIKIRTVDNALRLRTIVKNHKLGIRVDGHNKPNFLCDDEIQQDNNSITLYSW